jgi:hypothetical protein
MFQPLSPPLSPPLSSLSPLLFTPRLSLSPFSPHTSPSVSCSPSLSVYQLFTVIYPLTPNPPSPSPQRITFRDDRQGADSSDENDYAEECYASDEREAPDTQAADESAVGFASPFGPWSTRADRWGGATKMCLQVSGGGQGGKTGAAEGREAPYSIIGTRVSRFAADAPLSLSPPCFGTHVSLYYYTCGTHVSSCS